jgi:signal transduction histidine kinase
LLGVGAVASGSERLLVKDRRYRIYSWAAVVLLGIAWTVYFAALRTNEVRIALEVASVLVLVLAGFRVHALVRSGEVAPLTAGALGLALASLGYAVRSPWVAGTKAWLLAMVVFQGLGRAAFTWVEYGVVVTVLAGLITLRLLRRPGRSRIGSRARFGADAAAAGAFQNRHTPRAAKRAGHRLTPSA